MTWPSEPRLAQACICVLLLGIVRSLGEFFRLQYVHGEALNIAQVTPYVAGALFATVALALTVIFYFASRYRTSMAITAISLILLFVYKVVAIGG